MTLTNTFGNYQNEFGRAYEDGRHGLHYMNKEIPRMLNDVNLRSDFMKAVSDMSNVYTSQRLVIEVFAWSSVLVLGSSIGSVLGAYIFSPIIGSIFGKYIASLVAYILIPLGTHFVIRRKERNFVDENNIRMMMLGTSIAQGMLSGYTINSRYLEAQPLPFITPMVMSFGYAGIVDEAKGDRRMLISAALGAPLCANFLLGAFYGKLIASYNFLSLGYTAIGGIIMQLLFHKAHDKRGHIYQNMLNASFLLFKGLTFYLFGTYVE